MIRRFELISHMNDRIRNALQAIECLKYVSCPQETETVRREVDAIDAVLRDVLSDASLSAANGMKEEIPKASRKAI